MSTRAPMALVSAPAGVAGGVVEAEAVPERKADVLASMESERMLVRSGSPSRWRSSVTAKAAAKAEAIADGAGWVPRRTRRCHANRQTATAEP